MITPALTYFRVKTIIGPDCLTAVFGTGTGITSQVWAPGRKRWNLPAVVPREDKRWVRSVEGDRLGSTGENEVKPLDWLVPVS